MYNPGIRSTTESSQVIALKRLVVALRNSFTLANGVGLACGLLALLCLLALPEGNYWNIRIPLYLMLSIWTLLRPRAVLYLLPLSVAWGTLDTINIGLNLTSTDILVLLLIAAWLASFVLRSYITRDTMNRGPLDYKKGLQVPRYLVIALFVFLLAMSISFLTTVSLRASIKEIFKWLEVAFVILLGSQYLRTRHHIWTLVVFILIAGVSQALYGYVQYYFGIGPQSFIRDASLRIYGTFDQPNPYAGYINMSLVVATAVMLFGGNWKTRILAGAAVVLLGTAELLTKSRGGEIAISVALLFIVTLGMPLLRKLVAIGFVATLGIIAAYLGGILPDRVLSPVLKILGLVKISFTAPSSDNYATAERLAHWIAGIRMFVDHPFTGVGIGNYQDVYHKYFLGIFANPLGHAHNYYINMAAETGEIGLLAFLGFLIALFIAGWHAYRVISKPYTQMKKDNKSLKAGVVSDEDGHLLGGSNPIVSQHIFANDRALAIGLLVSLFAVCVHNMLDNLYVHGMTILFSLLLIALIRLAGVRYNKRS